MARFDRISSRYVNIESAVLAQMGRSEEAQEGEDHPVNNILAREAIGGNLGLAGQTIHGEAGRYSTGEERVPMEYKRPSVLE